MKSGKVVNAYRRLLRVSTPPTQSNAISTERQSQRRPLPSRSTHRRPSHPPQPFLTLGYRSALARVLKSFLGNATSASSFAKVGPTSATWPPMVVQCDVLRSSWRVRGTATHSRRRETVKAPSAMAARRHACDDCSCWRRKLEAQG